MKPQLIFSIILIFHISCKTSTYTDHKIITSEDSPKVTSIFKGSFFHANHDEEGIFFLYDIILRNNSKTPLEFWTLTASPQANIITDPEQINPFIPPFSSNHPEIIKLEKDQEFVVSIMLTRDYPSQNSIRFGFIILKPRYKGVFLKELEYSTNPRDELFEMRSKKENVIWSQTTEIHAVMNEYRYQIRTIINDSTYSIVPRERLFK